MPIQVSGEAKYYASSVDSQLNIPNDKETNVNTNATFPFQCHLPPSLSGSVFIRNTPTPRPSLTLVPSTSLPTSAYSASNDRNSKIKHKTKPAQRPLSSFQQLAHSTLASLYVCVSVLRTTQSIAEYMSSCGGVIRIRYVHLYYTVSSLCLSHVNHQYGTQHALPQVGLYQVMGRLVRSHTPAAQFAITP